MKKKYTKEQLEFYFRKLMTQLGRVPTEEDMENAKNMPSVSTYTERFGSWETAKKKFGDTSLNTIKCKNCGKTISFKKKTKAFCSSSCAKQYKTKEKLKKIKPKKCIICKKPFTALEVRNFKQRKTCNDKECNEKYSIILELQKQKRITPKTEKKLKQLKGNKCNYCDFNKILYFMTKPRKKLETQIRNKSFDYILVCPNHKEMIEKKMITFR